MKWILAILCGLALQAGAITNGVFATKDPYVVESATMPFDTWTNSVLWLTANSPVLNSGATNAQWICYAKNCVGNAFQTSTGYQPSTVDGIGSVKAIRFDGTDDYLSVVTSPAFSGTNSWAMSTWVNISSWPTGAVVKTLFSVSSTNNNQRSWLLNIRGPSATFGDLLMPSYSQEGQTYGANTNASISKTVATNGWVNVALSVRSGRYITIAADGVARAEVDMLGTLYASTSSFTFASSANVTTLTAYDLSEFSFFNRTLSTNEIASMFNSKKARYGK